MIPEKLRQMAFRVISRTQDDPDLQVMGTAVALVALTEATGTDMRSVIEIAERRMNDLDGPFTSQIGAIREYAKNEIGRR